MSDVDLLLNAQESELSKDQEIARILSCNPFDYFDILQVDDTHDKLGSAVKMSFRRKTLLVHPDKTSNPDAAKAFDKLKKAEQVLSIDLSKPRSDVDPSMVCLYDEKQRLMAIYQDVRSRNNEDGANTIAEKVSRILEQEMKSEKIEKDYQLRQEEQKAKELTKMRLEKELKQKMETKWEDERDQRVQNWRLYTEKVDKKSKKKGKKKKKVLA